MTSEVIFFNWFGPIPMVIGWIIVSIILIFIIFILKNYQKIIEKIDNYRLKRKIDKMWEEKFKIK